MTHRIWFTAAIATSLVLSFDSSSILDASQKPEWPEPREGAAMVYDPDHQEVLLFGGVSTRDSSGQNFPDDLWAWNGQSWRRLIPADGRQPTGRLLPHLAYDANRHRLLMLGGRRETAGGSVELPGDIWEWDGNRWQQASSRRPLLHATLVYHPVLRRIVAYGGLDTSGVIHSLTSWDGNRWQVLDSAGPPRGTMEAFPVVSGIAPDGKLRIVAMQSGRSSDSVAARVWDWVSGGWQQKETGPALTSLQPAASAGDGTIFVYQLRADWLRQPLMHVRQPGGQWTQRTVSGPPKFDGFPPAVFDEARQKLLLYSNGIWEWNGTGWIGRGPVRPGTCDAPPAGPLEAVCPYLSALVALDHDRMAQLWSPTATRVNLAGVEQRVDREFMRSMRDFERETHTQWTFQIDSVQGAQVYATLTESNDFYELIGVGKRTQTEEYLVRDGQVARMANTSMIQEKGQYGPAYLAFRDWLLSTEASQDPEITQGGGLRFTETSARHMLPWLKRYAELLKSR